MAETAARKEMGDQAEEIQTAPRPQHQMAMTDDIEDDPHRAALELNPEVAEKFTGATVMAVFLLGLSFTACISTALLLASSILVPIGLGLGDLEPIDWIAPSWALTSDNVRGVSGAFAKILGATPALIHATSEAYKSAYGCAYQRVFYSTIPFGIIAIAATIFIKDTSEYLTNHTAVNMEKNVLGGRQQIDKAVNVEQPEKTTT